MYKKSQTRHNAKKTNPNNPKTNELISQYKPHHLAPRAPINQHATTQKSNQQSKQMSIYVSTNPTTQRHVRR